MIKDGRISDIEILCDKSEAYCGTSYGIKYIYGGIVHEIRDITQNRTSLSALVKELNESGCDISSLPCIIEDFLQNKENL